MPTDYLMTITTRNGYSVHAYLMTADPRDIEHTASLMMDEAERQGLSALPLIMTTPLREDGRDTVRAFLAGTWQAVAEALKSATTFHQSVWLMPSSGPRNEQLMALH